MMRIFRNLIVLLVAAEIGLFGSSCNRSGWSESFREKRVIHHCAVLAVAMAEYHINDDDFVRKLCMAGVNKFFFVPFTKEYDLVRRHPDRLSIEEVIEMNPYEAMMLTDDYIVVFERSGTWKGVSYAIARVDYGMVERGRLPRDEFERRLENFDPNEFVD